MSQKQLLPELQSQASTNVNSATSSSNRSFYSALFAKVAATLTSQGKTKLSSSKQGKSSEFGSDSESNDEDTNLVTMKLQELQTKSKEKKNKKIKETEPAKVKSKNKAKMVSNLSTLLITSLLTSFKSVYSLHLLQN